MGEDADDESLNKLNKEDMISEMKKIGDMWPGSKDDVFDLFSTFKLHSSIV
jgi:hypothetical protein